MSYLSKKPTWKVRYEVTFHGNDPLKGAFREIKENTILIGEDLPLKYEMPFNTKENVEINFLLWVDGLPVEDLIKLPHDYYDTKVLYAEESIEVLEIVQLNNK
ncbi:hypothetical protein N9O69_00685 [Alphaproteobacteria bacterium]|nr:hypothetical protein [Alphaproteobacteria bacterium]